MTNDEPRRACVRHSSFVISYHQITADDALVDGTSRRRRSAAGPDVLPGGADRTLSEGQMRLWVRGSGFFDRRRELRPSLWTAGSRPSLKAAAYASGFVLRRASTLSPSFHWPRRLSTSTRSNRFKTF